MRRTWPTIPIELIQGLQCAKASLAIYLGHHRSTLTESEEHDMAVFASQGIDAALELIAHMCEAENVQ